MRAPFEATNQIQLAYKIKLGKIDRIPAHYSDELFHVICSMININMDKRPSVENLMMHPRICFVIKALEVRRKDSDVKRKEKAVIQLETQYKEQSELIDNKMRQIEGKAKEMADLEQRLQRRETQLILTSHKI